jgi:hypothetical protein
VKHLRLFVLAGLVALAPLARAQQSVASAPDGRRGFGSKASVADVLATVRSTKDLDRAFLAELDALPSELAVLEAGALERYRERGYLALFDRSTEPSLALVHAELDLALADPLAALSSAGPRAEILARMVSDLRLRVRAKASAAVELDVRELRRGLAVLRGATEGFVLLTQAEIDAIAARLDLSASFLRAARNDLRALRQVGDESEIERRAQVLLSTARASEGVNVKRAKLERELATLAGLQQAMESALFTTRLRSETHELLDWRQRVFDESVPLRDEALLWMPDSETAKLAPPEVQKLSRGERMRGARQRAQESAAIDPLDPEALWALAHTADYFSGLVESRPWYDRFLALRGIRSHDHRTYAERKLDAREREALDSLQRGLYGDAGASQPQGGGR